MKNILMIAYHFPPIRVSSGIQRILKFTQYLLEHNWQTQVLSIHPCTYPAVDNGQMREIPDSVEVVRAFAFDTSRHLAFKGRYLGWMALPDRWVSWCIGGFFSGLKLIYRHKPKIILSTYPIATAHLIGLILHRLTGIPWIADFRDSMTETDYPIDPRQRKVYRWIESQTVKHCSRAIFTTPSAIKMYANRYPQIPTSRWALIPNGYDEENFLSAEKSTIYKQLLSHKKNEQRCVLLHSGVLYPSERDPRCFFQALAELLKKKLIDSQNFKVILRATGHDELYSSLIQQSGLESIVFIEPGVPYETALAEMLTVDGLLLFQAANCNHQVPAKLYEYFRAKRPIFALTDSNGDTASILKDTGNPYVVPLNDKEAIVEGLISFLQDINQGKGHIANENSIQQHSRKSRTKLLARLLDDVVKD